MLKTIRNVLLLPVLSVLLASCADNAQPTKLPAQVYDCEAWPASPVGNYGWKETGNYIVESHEAYTDCHSKLQALKP